MKTDLNCKIKTKFSVITDWLTTQKKNIPQLLYTSVDLRESLYKAASIDTNIFPAGFNNLCHLNYIKIQTELQKFLQHYPNSKQILLFCEDHTRNRFYLENIYQLANIIEQAGYLVTICSFFNEHPTICTNNGYLILNTVQDHSVTIYCLDYLLKSKAYTFDICLLNNDFSEGNFDKLKELNIPIIPHPNLGWHQRKKSIHIETLNQLTNLMIKDCDISVDPWQLSTLIELCHNIDINNENDREIIAKKSESLFNKIKEKYKENKIKDRPYLVLKSDNGTYGMGVISIEHPEEILSLNRKKRNKLHKGKGSIPIQNLLLQEGVSTVSQVDQANSEEVIYNFNGETVGGFYRIHPKKTDKDILNSKGMIFKSFCSNQNQTCSIHQPTCGVKKNISMTSYVLAQLANLAAQKETVIL